jgi:hypothetical protein
MLSMSVAISGVGRDLDGKAVGRFRTCAALAGPRTGFVGAPEIATPPAQPTAISAAWFMAGWRDVPGVIETFALEATYGLGESAARHTYALVTNGLAGAGLAAAALAADAVLATDALATTALGVDASWAWRDVVPAAKQAALPLAAEAVRHAASAGPITTPMSVRPQSARTYQAQMFARRHARSRGPSLTESPV